MYTLDKLKELGFREIKEEKIGFTQYVNEVSENVHLVIGPSVDDFFIWIVDEDAEDKQMQGSRLIIDTNDIEQAISFCKIIVGLENY